jgi:hypothetical protein
MTKPTIRFPAMYEVMESIGRIDDLRAIFPEGKTNRLNWCFFSTSGVHGTGMSLDDLDECPDEVRHLTVLVVQPRACVIRFGNIIAEPDDVPWLRGLVASTIVEVIESQEGNLPEGWRCPDRELGP